MYILILLVVLCIGQVKQNRNNDNDNDKLQLYNVLQKRLISQKYKKYSPGKYAMLLYLAISIRWISIMFHAE